MNTLDDFEAMRGLSAGMLASARANDWERLTRLEHELANRRDALAAGPDHLAGLSRDECHRVGTIIREMQAHDHAIRQIVEPYLDSVRALLSRRARKRDLSRSYGAFAQSL
ncbi:MAG: flagellar protein FliT [Zoogloeaceae bacterium]|nr:flagellar protein FliT [Rhodocyclaceae bacterium]MCP5237171.1 flagellar protein FliT [Zoogloeaceae bacterium]